MRALLAIFITIGLLAAFYVVSALIYFDITGILVWVTSLWVGIDSAKIGLNRYKMGIACRPITLFCICILLWFIIFPWYLWARFKIKDGTAVLKNEPTPDLEEKPIKHFFRQLSRVMQRMAEWALMVFCALIFIFLLFCLEESWRGPRVWENYKHQLEAKGETFDWDAMIPPRVPDSQNFFSAPMMSEWFIRSSGKNVVVDDIAKRLNYSNSTPAVIIAEVTIELPGSHLDSSKADVSLQFGNPKSRQQAKELIQNIVEPSAFGVRGTDTLVVRPLSSFQIKPLRVVLKADKKPDIREFIAFFTGNDSVSGPLFFKPAGTNSYHILTSFCIAPDYLKWSDQFQINFDMMREAVKRPYARMDGDYSNPLMIPIPNYVAVRAVSQTLAQRAQCLLLLGQPEKALHELTLLNDLRRLTECAPTGKPMTLVSAMINVAVAGLYVNVIADGFRLHAWQEPQLIALQKQLGQINLAPFVKESFREEQVSVWRSMCDVIAKLETPRVPNATLWQKIKNLQRPNILKGILILNIVTAVKMDQMIVDSIDLSQKVVSLKKTAEFQREINTFDQAHAWQVFPYKLLAAIAVPNFTKSVQTFAFNQTKTDEAQIVCALERYRLAHGHYPKTLNELVPQFIDKLPHDIIGGQPLKYHQMDGQFLLYSVGWNETDDGGQFNPSYDQADWVWQ